MIDSRRLSLVGQGEHDELPDATLTEAQRTALKSYVVNVEPYHSYHELMYLACAFEDAARRKKSKVDAL